MYYCCTYAKIAKTYLNFIMQSYYIHPTTPQSRLIAQVASVLQTGIVVCPTDTGYRLIAQMSAKTFDKLKTLTQQDDPLAYPILFADLSQLSYYATLDNTQHRLIKNNSDDSTAFILPATKAVPKVLLSKNKTLCTAFAQGAVIKALVEVMEQPLISYPLYNIDETLTEPYLIQEALGKHINGIIDVGTLDNQVSTVLDL